MTCCCVKVCTECQEEGANTADAPLPGCGAGWMADVVDQVVRARALHYFLMTGGLISQQDPTYVRRRGCVLGVASGSDVLPTPWNCPSGL